MRSLRVHLLEGACALLVAAPACAARVQVEPPPEAAARAPAPQQTRPEQTPPATVEPAATPSSDAAPAADPAAAAGLATLAQAARFQRGEEPRPRPTSLHGSFYVGVRDQTGALIKASAERWYTATPERLLTTRAESVTGSRSTIGFDGSRAWYRDEPDGRVVVYTDAPETFEVDLEQLHEQLRLTRLLLDAAVLDALIPRLHEVRSAARQQLSDPDGDVHTVQHVTALIADELFPPPAGSLPDPAAPAQLALDFAVDVETGALWALRVTAVGRPDVAPLDLRFALHGRTRSGLRVPGNIKVFRGDETRESVSLGVAEDGDVLVFDIDAPIDPSLFAVPQG